MILPSVIEAIGGTPLVALDRLTARLGLSGRLLAKLENLNPGHSKKDRAARAILLAARADGSLAPGQTVVELTSGNIGTGLALCCAVLGHPFVAVMSAGNSRERAAMMRALGAEVVLVPQVDGSPGRVTGADLAAVEAEAQAITARRAAFRADQFRHPGNAAAHAAGTAAELWAQTGGALTAVCDFAGSGGTLGGLARALAPRGVRVWAVEPAGSEALAGGRTDRPDHPIQGGGYGMARLAHLEGAPLAGHLAVTGEEARAHARLLARSEGILGGYSAGANLAAAVRLLQGPEAGGTVAFLVCDSGMKYLSTDLWEDGP